MHGRAIERIHRLGLGAMLAALIVAAPPSATPTVAIDLNPSQDNSLYEDFPTFSNGAGTTLYGGQTNNFGSRRALLAFNVAGGVAPGSIVTAATLTLNATLAGPTASDGDVYTLHRLTASWGESTSNAGTIGGVGAPAATGDATWTHRFWKTTLWTTVGGDFVAAPSASAPTPRTGLVVFTLDPLEVQNMLDTPGTDFGWILIGVETLPGSARRFDSREGAVPPVLHLELGQAAVCGDGSVDAGEECDEGANNSNAPGAFCRTDCTLAGCGDSILDPGEACDDGNTSAGDGCDPLCQYEVFCGNGHVDRHEECDEGAANSESPGATCRTDCMLAGCGDSVVDPGEQCDAGGGNSNNPGAFCRMDCSFGGCGDGILDPGETCDDGNNVDGDACPGNCGVETIPTLSEWGQIVMLLLLLIAGTLGVRRVATLTGSSGSSAALSFEGVPWFDPASYARVLAAVLALVACGLGATLAATGVLAGVDVAGALISAPILAYLVHLWRMRGDE